MLEMKQVSQKVVDVHYALFGSVSSYRFELLDFSSLSKYILKLKLDQNQVQH